MRCLIPIMFLGLSAFAGHFDSYQWRSGFRIGGGHYQPTLKISYSFIADGDELPNVLGIPRDDNLSLQKLVFKVDGKKVNPMEDRLPTWWSDGQPVPVFMPPAGSKTTASALFVIKNLFLIPPAPLDLAVPIKKLEVGFLPLNKFVFSGSFVGEPRKFKHKKIAAKTGEPDFLQLFTRKKVPANEGKQGLFFLVPKQFTFSFNLLRGKQHNGSNRISGAQNGAPKNVQELFGGDTQGAGSPGMGDADLNTSELKPYAMVFYTQVPVRDWAYAPTWLQQERTYLPFGVLPGGRVASRSLFAGAGDKTDDLISWLGPDLKSQGDAVANDDSAPPYQAIDLFLKDFRALVKINRNASTLVAYKGKSEILSPALANRQLANEIHSRFGVKTAPALSTNHDPKIAASLPISAFHGVITGMQIAGRWFFVDAADSSWNLQSSGNHLKGRNVLVLAEKLEMFSY